MQSHATAFAWIRTHRRAVAIIVAVALAFTILAGIAVSHASSVFDEPAASGTVDDSMVVAGHSWTRMVVPDPRGGGGATTMGHSWG